MWIQSLWNSGQFGPALVISWIAWVIVSITMHELAHGWVAIRRGDTTPIDTGHMTWNPLVHMGPWSLIMLLLVGIAWGAMPVDPTRIRGRHGEALVLIAGPAMNLLLAILAFIGLALWEPIAARAGVQDPLLSNFVWFFKTGVMLNIVLMLFNLLPVPPLDGGRILAHYSRGFASFVYSPNGQWITFGDRKSVV